VARYGEWILLSPRRTGLGAIAWGAPAGVAAAATVGLVAAFRRWRRDRVEAEITDEEADLVATAMSAWVAG